MNLKSILAAGLTSAATLATAAETNTFKLVDPKTLMHPYVETIVASDYVSQSGAAIPGKCIQSLLNLDLNKRLSGFIWQNYSLKSGAVNERDFGLSWNQPINKQFSANFSGQYWGYPTGEFGDFDAFAETGIKYSGKVDVALTYKHLFWEATEKNGDQLHLKISKTYDLTEKLPFVKRFGLKASLTPSVSASALHNWYGSTDQLAHVSPRLDLKIEKDDFTIKTSITQQCPVDSSRNRLTWWEAGIGFAF